jgi:TonB-linked SusC/RagA family outer membrane protein
MEISNPGAGLLCAVRKLLPQQLRRVMKLTALLLTVACIQVNAHSYSQTVSFSGKNVPLTVVFASIEKQTGLSFFFNYAVIRDTKPVSAEMTDVPLQEALGIIFKGQDLDYYLQGKTVFVTVKEHRPGRGDGLGSAGGPVSMQIEVIGLVTDLQGIGLAGASVKIKNARKGTITDEKGMFKLANIMIGSKLEISYTGFEMKEVDVVSDQPMTITLTLSKNQLDETEVIAYGNTTQRLSTGDVTAVKAEDIDKQPVTNPLLALEGMVPGLVITQNSGLPGTGVVALIHGQNSLSNGNDPFYVVDGVPYSQGTVAVVGGMLGTSGNNGGYGSPLDYINPSDIESISVLKDADATAIYGSRAANGAILITTKKGKSGRMRVGIDCQAGYGHVGKMLSLLNTPQYVEMRYEGLKNDGIAAPAFGDYDINGLWDTTRYTNWQKLIIGNNSQYTTVSGNVSGGNTNTQYYVSGTYHKETTVFPADFSDQKGSLHFDLTGISENQKFKIQVTGNYVFDDNNLPGGDFTGMSNELAPDAPKLYNANGSLNWAPDSTGASSWTNPLAAFYLFYENKTNNLVSNSVLSYKIIPGLEVRSSFGYTYMHTNEILATPLTYYPPERRATGVRVSNFGEGQITSWVIEPQVNYRHDFGNGKLDALIGSSIQERNKNSDDVLNLGYTSDQLLRDIAAAPTAIQLSNTTAEYKYNALFARVNYNLSDRYIVNGTVRRDGSSRFGADNQFHDFGAIGAAWLFGNEHFIKDDFSFLSYGKLGLSYGTTGNDQIGDYNYLSLYNPYSVAVSYQGVAALTPAGLSNSHLQWEETKKLEFSLNLGMNKDKILLTANYFRNRSSNQLVFYTLPVVTGFSGINENFPATVQNTGLEISISTTNIRTRDFKWITNFNISIPQNKLISFPNLATSNYANNLIVGKPVSMIKVYHYEGVNPSTGVYQFGDAHGGVTSMPDTNSLVTANSIINTLAPKLYGGLQNNITYKGIELSFLLQFLDRIGQRFYFGNSVTPGTVNSNQPTTVLARWQQAGDNKPIQAFSSNSNLQNAYNDVTNSDAQYADAAYIKIKNIALSWQLPSKWINNIHLRSGRIYLHLQNAFTFTRYKGYDPETLSVISLPTLRVIVMGAQINL